MRDAVGVGYRRWGEQGRGAPLTHLLYPREGEVDVCSEGKESGPRAGVSRVSRRGSRGDGGGDAEGEGEGEAKGVGGLLPP